MSYDNEQAEIDRLINEINRVSARIQAVEAENRMLEADIVTTADNALIMAGNTEVMDRAVNKDMGAMTTKLQNADLDVSHVFEALYDLSSMYFAFKNISTATKNLTQYDDEYFTRFSTYHELRRISLGYIVAVDSNVVSNASLRKVVEKSYLKNSEYWLAYCTMAVMLWASDEKAAAGRALKKALTLNYGNSCLFFLLVNLRFSRLDTAKLWYTEYLEKTNIHDIGEEWQYMLQAYLYGAFGQDPAFQQYVADCLIDMLKAVELTSAGFDIVVRNRAYEFARTFIHNTEHVLLGLRHVSPDYDKLIYVLSSAEKNMALAKHFNKLADSPENASQSLPERIEDVLYSLVDSYEDEEYELIKKKTLSEAVVRARGDMDQAMQYYNELYGEKVNMALRDLLLRWAFADETERIDKKVRKFSIASLSRYINEGIGKYVDEYRAQIPDRCLLDIDDCKLTIDGDTNREAEDQLMKHYEKNRWSYILKDKFVLIFGAVTVAALAILAIMIVTVVKTELSPANTAVLVGAIVAALVGAFLLWRRIVDFEQIFNDKKRKGLRKLKAAIDDFIQWVSLVKEADAQFGEINEALERVGN